MATKRDESLVSVPIPDGQAFSEAFLKLLWDSSTPMAKQHLADRVMMEMASEKCLASREFNEAVSSLLKKEMAERIKSEDSQKAISGGVSAMIATGLQDCHQETVLRKIDKEVASAIEACLIDARSRVTKIAEKELVLQLTSRHDSIRSDAKAALDKVTECYSDELERCAREQAIGSCMTLVSQYINDTLRTLIHGACRDAWSEIASSGRLRQMIDECLIEQASRAAGQEINRRPVPVFEAMGR